MIKHILLLFLLLNLNTLYAQCDIKDFEMTNFECKEGNSFDATISFANQRIQQDKFTLYADGKVVGTYAYFELPITYTVETYKEYIHYTVVDEKDGNCYLSSKIKSPFCSTPCQILVDDIEISDCASAKMDIAFNVRMNDIHGDSIYVTLPNGIISVFPKNQRITLPKVESSADVRIPIKICGNKAKDCCITYEFNNKCLCDIYNATYYGAWCDPTTQTYGIVLDFDHHMVSDSFQLGGNSMMFGHFAYKDLPVQVDSLPLESQYNISPLILDLNASFCFNELLLDTMATCSDLCTINEFTYEVENCTPSGYDISFNIKNYYSGTEGFEVYIDDLKAGEYAYGQSSYTLPIRTRNCNVYPTIRLVDKQDTTCSYTKLIDELPCCDKELEFQLEKIECDKSELTYRVKNTYNTGQNHNIIFKQNGATVYTAQKVANTSISVSTEDFKQGLVEVSYAYSDGTVEARDVFYYKCSCLIGNIEVTTTECRNDGKFDAILKFTTQAGSGKIDIRGNGVSYGTFDVGQDSYKIENLDGDCTTLYEFVVSDSADASCRKDVSLTEPICCTECKITELEASNKGCTSDTTFFEINFKAINPKAATFTLKVDDNAPILYAYNNLPVTVSVPTLANHRIEVFDNENLDCNQVIEIDSECMCTFSDVKYEILACDNSKANIAFDIKYNFDNNVVLLLNNQYVGIYKSEQFPVTLSNLTFDKVATNKIEVQSTIDQQCTYVYTIEPRDCTVSTTEFQDASIYVVNNILYIQSTDIDNITVSLHDVHGKLKERHLVNMIEGNATLQFDPNTVPGLYICTMITKHGRISKKVLLK